MTMADDFKLFHLQLLFGGSTFVLPVAGGRVVYGGATQQRSRLCSAAGFVAVAVGRRMVEVAIAIVAVLVGVTRTIGLFIIIVRITLQSVATERKRLGPFRDFPRLFPFGVSFRFLGDVSADAQGELLQ